MYSRSISLSGAEDLISRYTIAGGEVVETVPGSLGLGTVVLRNNGLELKEFVIQEVYLNEWSSGHVLKVYTKGLPKKYEKAADLVLYGA